MIGAGGTADLRQTVEAVSAALQAGDLAGAKAMAQKALVAGVEHPLLFNLRAMDHEDAGRFEAALADLRRAHVLAPDDFAILNACGLCLARLDRLEEALSCQDQAVALEPRFGAAWFNRGWVLERLGQTAEAAESYAKCVALIPQHTLAWASMAFLAARRGDAAGVRRFAEKALRLEPDQPTATLALASIDAPADAERRLRALLAAPNLGAVDRGIALGQLGDALDAQDRPAEAFAAYSEGNRVFRDEARPQYEAPGRPTVADAIGWLLAWVEQVERRPRPAASAGSGQGGETGHVFLMGFPRSGTTLIESVLAAHPDVVSLEERNTLQTAVRTFLGDPRSLAGLKTVRDLQFYRDDYWSQVRRYGVEPSGKLFIDKNPFNALRLPLIYNMFPNAKILFSIRDPRDVLFSCFRRRFGLNPSTYELLDLERAAAFYDGVMRFAEAFRRKHELIEHTLVYERLVGNFEAESRATCDFIGADWRPELADFAGRGRRGEVASASAAQISRGLYSDGAGQWRRYRAQLEPVMDRLRPWVERFGYPAD